jgi:GT2 family glycosyltransferase
VAEFVAANYSTCCALYRREVWESIGGYDEAMLHGGEDWDFWVRALAAGYRMIVVSDILMRYRVYSEDRAARHNSSARLRRSLADVQAYMHAKWQAAGIE